MTISKQKQTQLAQALYTVNRHVKTAQDKKPLYQLKKDTLIKLIELGYAKKTGLHFSENPTRSKQHSTTLVEFDSYLFHLPSSPEDKKLPHLGKLDFDYSNPASKMSLQHAKKELESFLGLQVVSPQVKKKTVPAFYTSLSTTPSPSEYRRAQKNPFKN
ncbi:YkyB family protein [Chryseomicrobium sp. FSL W7-1435]|uniref:YkyB family protein n=1 Tax=Chryseomicrobium sp. FSL W7-1435 TaxID=2921704 RepID=UPI00315AFC6D